MVDKLAIIKWIQMLCMIHISTQKPIMESTHLAAPLSIIFHCEHFLVNSSLINSDSNYSSDVRAVSVPSSRLNIDQISLFCMCKVHTCNLRTQYCDTVTDSCEECRNLCDKKRTETLTECNKHCRGKVLIPNKILFIMCPCREGLTT